MCLAEWSVGVGVIVGWARCEDDSLMARIDALLNVQTAVQCHQSRVQLAYNCQIDGKTSLSSPPARQRAK